MRVIAGSYRSRQLVTPRGMDTRPTSDRLRETLFNVLAPRIAGARFADLFAGSGAVGIEALSRGASFCWFAENARPALAAIRQNLSALGIAGGFALEDRSVARLIRSIAESSMVADLVFLDPPYAATDAYADTLRTFGTTPADLLAESGLVIAEHTKKQPLMERYGALERTRVLTQGDAALSFYAISANRQV